VWVPGTGTQSRVSSTYDRSTATHDPRAGRRVPDTSAHGRRGGTHGRGHGNGGQLHGSGTRPHGPNRGPARGLAGWFRRWYGAQPLHLLALLAAFALAGYAVRGVVEASQWRGFALWFAVAIVGHDLLLFPLYSLADLSVRRLLPGRPGARRRDVPGPGPGPASRPSSASPSRTSFSQTNVFDPAPGPASHSGPGQPSGRHPGSAHSAATHSAATHSAATHSAASSFATQVTPAASSVRSGINYLRVPAAFSLLLLAVWFPLILGLSEHNYHRASGLVTSPYLGRWLAVTGVLFAASAASYALALRRASASARRARRSRHPATSSGGPGRADRTRHASRHRRHRIH